jgi:PAS domain-containing protein
MRHGLLEPASLQRMLYDTLDQSDDLVVVLEKSGPDCENIVVATANDAFCRAVGRSHDGLTGQTFASFVAEEGDRDRSWPRSWELSGNTVRSAPRCCAAGNPARHSGSDCT